MRDHVLSPSYIGVAQSTESSVLAAVRDVVSQIDLSETCFVLVFAPNHLACDPLAAALQAELDGVPAFGCTSAGQITLQGYETDALLVLAFPKAHFRCASVMLGPLSPLSIPDIAEMAERHVARFPHTAGWNRFSLFFADGLSKQEDLLASILEVALGGLPVFGGSAGDGMVFEKTHVLHQGRFHTNAAVLLVLETNLHVEWLSFDHFTPSDVQLIITDANSEERIVYEINGAPAATEYARLVGCDVSDLTPQVFAENPMLVQHQGNHYVRAISEVADNQALRFLAAIDEGLIMVLGRGKALVETLEDGLQVASVDGKEPDFILGFDCALRKLELEQKGLDRVASDVFRARRVVGFNTYGEQFRGLHMNQTFLGAAFFDPDVRVLT